MSDKLIAPTFLFRFAAPRLSTMRAYFLPLSHPTTRDYHHNYFENETATEAALMSGRVLLVAIIGRSCLEEQAVRPSGGS